MGESVASYIGGGIIGGGICVSSASVLPVWAEGLRGRMRADAPLSARTWFQVGGAAQWLYTPADSQDLQQFMRVLPYDVPLHSMGVGSNLLVRDGGLRGVMLRLGRGFTELGLDGEYILAGAAVLDTHIADFSCQNGRDGLAFLCGIPGTMGGALAMNAGAYGSDISQVLEWAEYIDRSGALHRVSVADLHMGYRHCALPEGAVFIRACLRTKAGDVAAIAEHMQRIRSAREATQPVRMRTGGSAFANPDGHKAWQLIDSCGLRGATRGGAEISALHCNFLVNNGTATAADLEWLGEEARSRVRAQYGIDLRWEIRRIGEAVEQTKKVGQAEHI